jgi:hypothetical protein
MLLLCFSPGSEGGGVWGRHQTVVELRVHSDGSALDAICVGVLSSDGAKGHI